MRMLTKKEYAKLAGITTKDLSTYIKREKVICYGNLIDPEVPENQLFIEHRLEMFPMSGLKDLPSIPYFKQIMATFNKALNLSLNGRGPYEMHLDSDRNTQELLRKLNWILSLAALLHR